MQKSKLIATLKNFSKQDLENLIIFMDSKLIFEEKEIKSQRKLIKYLIKFYPYFKNKKLEKEKVFKLIYNSDYSSATLNRINGRLLSNVKYYINNISDNKLNPITNKLKESILYLQNGDENLFNQSILKLEKENNKNNPSNDYFLNGYLIENQKLDFNYLYNQRKGKLNIKETSLKLDQFYITKKLELILSSIAQNKFAHKSNINKSLEQFSYIKIYISNNKNLNLPITEIYIKSIEMIQDDDINAYGKLKKLLTKYKSKLTLNENQNFHTLTRNFCLKQYSLGDESYLKEAFKCYKHDLENNYLYHNGGILASTMQSIVKLGLRMNESTWVKSFLKKHKTKLIGTREPELVYNYNMSVYYFHNKLYEKCLDTLDETLEDIHYKTSAKRLMIKALFETKSPVLDSRLNAFKIYIFRISTDSFTALHKKGNSQFINILKQIINPSTLSNSSRKDSIRTKIVNTQVLADKQWLLDKLE